MEDLPMGHNEQFEATKAADSMQENKISNFNSYVLDRGANGRSMQDVQMKTDSMVAAGALPSLDLFSDAKTGTVASAKELKDSGIKTQTVPDGTGEGTKTSTEFPNGVKITSAESTSHHGKIETTTNIQVIEASPPNHKNKAGEVIDEKGRVIAKPNEDGSITVDSGKGFYTHYPNGEIRRESAIRSRDGKTFDVIDTNTPLGNLRPGDMVHK